MMEFNSRLSGTTAAAAAGECRFAGTEAWCFTLLVLSELTATVEGVSSDL